MFIDSVLEMKYLAIIIEYGLSLSESSPIDARCIFNRRHI